MELNSAVNAVLNSDPVDATARVKAKLQVSMLRKSLDAQEQEAQSILQMLEGKGRNIDIRA